MSGKVYFKPIDSMFVLQRLHSAEILTCFSVSHSDLFGRGGNRLTGLSTYETSVTLLYDIHVYIMCSVVTSVNATLAQTAAKHVLHPLRVPRTVPRERHLRLRISRTAYATRTRPEPY